MGYSTHPAISIIDVPVISIEILIIVKIASPRKHCSLFAYLSTATSGYLASYLVVAVFYNRKTNGHDKKACSPKHPPVNESGKC